MARNLRAHDPRAREQQPFTIDFRGGSNQTWVRAACLEIDRRSLTVWLLGNTPDGCHQALVGYFLWQILAASPLRSGRYQQAIESFSEGDTGL
jgi:hypothetical protein